MGESVEQRGTPTSGRFTGCQVAALIGAALFVAGVCLLTGFLVGGLAGYGLGRGMARPAQVGAEPRLWPTPSPPLPPSEERPYLGIYYRPAVRGAYVAQVVPGSPAEEGGLEPGDVILAVDGERVTRSNPLNRILLSYHPGDVARLRVERDGERLDLEVTLGRWPSP